MPPPDAPSPPPPSAVQAVYPLNGLPRQGQIWSWISFDVANQSFTLLINTLLFALFFKKVVVQDPARDDLLWSLMFAASMVLTVIASPFAGAISDDRGWRKAFLLASGFSCGVLTCMLGLIQPGQLWLTMLLYIPANFMFNIGENFLASFLPDVARREDYGKVSGFSWGVAYSAALVLLIITGLVMTVFGLRQPDQWRPLFVFAGAWFIAMAIPTAIWLRESPPPPLPQLPPGVRRPNPIAAGVSRLKESIGSIREYRDLVMLLAASLFYGAGMNVIIFFASIIASEFGFSDVALVVFVAVITVSGVGGTLVTTLVQDKIGHKLTTVLLLLVWIATALAFVFYAQTATRIAGPANANIAQVPKWPLWVLGNLIGFGLGSLGSANRAFVGALTPPGRTGEVFGLWGMVFKLAAVLTIPFAIVKDVLGTPASLVVLVVFLVVGLVLTLLINERRGTVRAMESATASSDAPGSAQGV
ncbi:MAG: MFS transporter [Phycisphaerales bacterium]|nr:MFS transporter [Phycisphaerales bacterium]